ncbi:glycerophosphodiester phosphodiesterase [Spirosoma sp. KCTC 42546]|uniref:glycerophosphodiester phosphodiesterase n=1 Tax=Spirosoma sp. KCTC 42546 TaxID=2520506 RepID=UPI001159FE1F|nr:glycerophosphodiester phosphodiesterase [Spirosoma sp. KCTC 42546]QDK82806.1 glycerophosphodiester phosphodiesterase [Spirosoma sp. KCTC 42546]
MKNISVLGLLLCSQVLMAQPKLDRQGHRGCRGLMPENTIPAMKKALDLGVQTLELDVVISKDKQVVVSHDTYMSADIALKPDGKPVTAEEQKQLNLYQLTYAEIKKFDVGSKPHPQFGQQQKFPAYKPLLANLIDSVNTYAKAKGIPLPLFNIEIKSMPTTDGVYHPEPKEFVELVLTVCKAKNLGKQLTIQSFDVRPLQLIHKQSPEIPLSYLTANAKSLADNLATLGFTPHAYSPYYKTVTAEVVKACHQQGMVIIPWTVNSKVDIDSLIQLGVDGIISDYPNLFL